MATLGLVHVGDIKTQFKITVNDTIGSTTSPLNLANFNTFSLIFTKPDGTTVTKTPVINNPPGTDGVLLYSNTDSALIDQGGLWKVRAVCQDTVGSSKYTSNDATFEVLS